MNPIPDPPLGALNPLAFRRSPRKRTTPHSFATRYLLPATPQGPPHSHQFPFIPIKKDVQP